MNQGWIKLHRQLLENPRFKDPDWVSVWTYLLLTATHAHRETLFDGRRVELKPGQLITGRFKIAKATGVHESKVCRILKTLKTDQQIEQQAGAKSSMITVLNWAFYQNTDQQNEQQSISNRTASEQQVNTIQEGEEGEEGEDGTPDRGGEPTESEWLNEAERIGYAHIFAGELEALHAFHSLQGPGWVDKMGAPITNWRGMIRSRMATSEGRLPHRDYFQDAFETQRRILQLRERRAEAFRAGNTEEAIQLNDETQRLIGVMERIAETGQ